MQRLLDLLNLSDSGFPTGGFGHSAGLEYAVQAGWVNDAETLAAWARGVLGGSFFPLDLRAAVKAWVLEGDHSRLQATTASVEQSLGMEPLTAVDRLLELNTELAAFRTSRTQRQAQAQIGRSFLRSVAAFYPETRPSCAVQLARAAPDRGDAVQFSLAWGSVCRGLSIGLPEMAAALAFSCLRQMTMVAMRVVPLGQSEAFAVQTVLLAELRWPTDWVAEAAQDLSSFAPGLDLAGLGMDNLARRYFRS